MTDKDSWGPWHKAGRHKTGPKPEKHNDPERRSSRNRPKKAARRRLLWWLVFLAVFFILANWLIPGFAITSAYEILAISTLIIVGSVVIVSLRLHYKEFFRYVALWAAIILVLAAAYAFRHEISYIADRIAGATFVSRGYVQEDAEGKAMVFERGRDGHFHIRAQINGEQVHFLVDTGATNVVLTRKDAEKLGIRPDAEQYFERYYTANGVVMAAPVLLDSITIGDTIHITSVRASVSESDLGVSLLGMSFLNRLGRIEISGDHLVIRQ